MAKGPVAKARFAGLLMELPPGWREITDDLDEPSPPTLSLEDGIGVMQFSVAIYTGGERPSATETDLKEMFSELCEKQCLKIEPSSWAGNRAIGVGGMSASDSKIVGAWYVFNGSNLAFVTYASSDPRDPKTLGEFRDAESIVRSIEFDHGRSG